MMLALDIGASKMRAALIFALRVKEREVIATPKTKRAILQALFTLIDSYNWKGGIGVGIASFLHNGKTINTCNMDFANVNLLQILRERYKATVFIDNDANCAGLGELYYGRGKGKKNFVLLTLGTGIGGAIIIDGKLYRGNSFGGEPGQMLINGKRLEELASGPAALSLAKEHGLVVRDNYALRKLAERGNAKALGVYRSIGKILGIGVLNISYIVDPEIIILGGGFSNVPYIIKEARKTLHKEDVIGRKIPVVHAKLGDDAGLIGAALLPLHPQ